MIADAAQLSQAIVDFHVLLVVFSGQMEIEEELVSYMSSGARVYQGFD